MHSPRFETISARPSLSLIRRYCVSPTSSPPGQKRKPSDLNQGD